MNKKELLAIAQHWFTNQGWKPFPFQKKAWDAYLKGENGLLNAPTGSGKTYALWVPIVLEYLKKNPDYKTKHQKGLKAIWITPLRALSVEIAQAASRFAEETQSGLTVGIRTGDTSQKERAAQKKAMPDLLITTPESLHLLLSSKNYPKLFKNLNAIVVDEWHELLGSKRGVQTELALSRLKTVAKNLKIWGISATIGNLDQAREVLLGAKSEALQHSTLIKANIQKKIEVKSIIPESMEKFPWRGHLGLHLLDEVVPIINNSKTTLIFTNTRSQCELWFQKLMNKYPEFAGEVAMHHGSINKETRLWVEQAIRNESLKAVICTSSLDLGVDFAPVETIIQIGGPKGVARFLQRAGRSGHQPGKASRIYFLPTHAIELIEASALQKAVEKKAVEDRIPYLQSFDVLVQYLTTLAVSDGFYPKEIYPEIKSTFCFQGLTDEEWRWCLNFITKGSQSLQTYDEYKKVEIEDDGKFKVNQRGVAMRHRLQIGTIVSDAMLTVKYVKGGFIGTIEEWFVSKLSPGDVFTFAGRNLELSRIKGMQVLVRKSKKKTAKVPSWMGGRMAFSAQMSELLREELYEAAESFTVTSSGVEKSPELKALQPILERQQLESIIPKHNEFLIETFKTREGYHAIFYPFEGRFVHEALGSLLAYRISLLSPISFSIAFNDYGFELLSDQEIDMQQLLDNDLFSAKFLMDDLYKSLNATEMARRKFRDIAVIAGLVFTGYPNKLIKSKHLQSSSQLLFDVFRDYEDDNLLFQQAFRETFEHQLEEGRLRQALERIHQQKIVWKSCQKPTPFSFPIITDRLREKLSSEKLEDRIQRMLKQFEK
ncbi:MULTISPECIES: ligase-associated DNA damage response DEXH box helicase [Mesonia]|uniref:DEAD-box ATP-dependent RNA helicase RhpA n=1 Tax=Mesonia oceanica TaxID=2687242 RepID=A0AC61Y3I1_9FLAO|nr:MULTISPECIES: ligase-associated DNA damage response DEXH box helicase [Mesonia]MAN26372.1 DNA ligase-associated DEXH box helicase [Mesonia sp.]MBJ97508.1 DNA ligase-associated DEXH box helicase [Flavobacteriaceae bacterium]VVU98982.1 DEAD-box ATP-dependent RNA helicase RhpA [Mesonia oceanica]|tara:strand:+ start:16051 stop:18531 length:2481 start_codon:yes stop_codon:yes gene_type:complete